jgi:hypothetical protein
MRNFRSLVLGLVLVSLAGLSTAAPASFTEDTIYLQCTNVGTSDAQFVAITPPAKKASVFLLRSKQWSKELELLTTPTLYMFDLMDDWNFVVDRVDLRLTTMLMGSAKLSECSIVESGMAENYAKQLPKPRI